MRIELFIKNHERALLLTLCMIAMARVFIYSTAFPFFTNVDEQDHFDLVVKYSHGRLPQLDAINFDRESAELIALYGSPEYFNRPTYFEGGKIPPPFWRFRKERVSVYVEKMVAERTARKNKEALSPPVYYALAGVWYDIGKLLGMRGGHLLYWVRFLNVMFYAVLMWFAYLLCCHVFADDSYSRVCTLLLAAVFPQSIFFSINSDVLSPLLCLIALYCMVLIIKAPRTVWLHLAAGAATSAAFLTKFSNLPVLLVFALFIIMRVKHLMHEGRLREQTPNLTVLALGALVPIVCWLGRNSMVLHDISGNSEKIRDLGWTVKPFSEMLHHPLFTLSGSSYFISELLKTFWRGEFVWGLNKIASTFTDDVYVASSCIFVISSLIAVARKGDNEQGSRQIVLASVIILLSSVLLLAMLSLIYDFGSCWYPSRRQPYIVSGRIILGAFVPFLVLYVYGLRKLLARFKRIYLLIVVSLISMVMVISEIVTTYPVFSSGFNWYHLF